MSKRMQALWAGVVACALWGGLYPVTKVVMEVLPPFVLVATRLILGPLFLLPFVWRRGGFRWRWQTWDRVLAVGLVGFGASQALQFVGTHLSTASNGVLVTSATPAFVALFGAWVLGERLHRRQIFALVVATLGVLVLIDPRTARWDDAVFVGNLALLGAALTWALYSVLVRWLTRNLPTLEVSVGVIWGGLPLMLPLALWQSPRIPWEAVSWPVVLGVLYVALFATAAAMFLWNYAFAHLESGTAALTFFVQPVVGVLVGALWLGERVTMAFVLGGVLIGLGVYLAAMASPSSKKTTERCDARI